MSIVQLDNVTKKIRNNVVLNNVSIEFHSGRITGLSGENGSGKTMILRLIAGLIYPTSGNVCVDGKILGKEIEFPPSIGILIENPSFLDGYDGFHNLSLLSLLENRISNDHIHDALKRVGLDIAEKKKYRKYSLGMKQRLGIASAILGHPEIILLDEPTNALDTYGVQLLQEIIREEANNGATVILASHNFDFLSNISDEIYFLGNGRLLKSIQKNEVI